MAITRSVITPEPAFQFPASIEELARVDEQTRLDLERRNQRLIEDRFNLQRRLIFHDDFLYVGAVPDVGDTHWEDYGTAGTLTVVTPPTSVATAGLIGINTNATSGQWFAIGKSDLGTVLPNARTEAFYLKCRFALSTYAQTSFLVGLSDATTPFTAPTEEVAVFIANNTASTTPTMSFSTRAAGTATQTAVGTVSGWRVIEILANQSWAAAALDGGPWIVHTTNIPTAGMMGAFCGLYPYDNAAKSMYLDYVHLDYVSDLTGPP